MYSRKDDSNKNKVVYIRMHSNERQDRRLSYSHHRYVFRLRLDVLLTFDCICAAVGLVGGTTAFPSPLCTRDLGFRGDSTPDRDGGRSGPSPVTLRREGGTGPTPDPEGGVGGFVLSIPFAYGNVVSDVTSVPRTCRRAFSCFICTVRKC